MYYDVQRSVINPLISFEAVLLKVVANKQLSEPVKVIRDIIKITTPNTDSYLLIIRLDSFFVFILVYISQTIQTQTFQLAGK